MKKNRPIVLKIGGSVITDKREELKVKMRNIVRLAEEIQESKPHKLIIVHGGGSFGHPLAKRYSLREGLKEENQKVGFSETHHMMTVLNGVFMDTLVGRNMPAVSLPPSSFIITKNSRIHHWRDRILKTLLDMEFLPVLYGDVVLDSKLGITVLSGDQLVSVIATHLNAKRIILGVDVDGLYDADPKLKETAKIFPHLSLKNLRSLQNKLGDAEGWDVTGGMSGKINEMLPAIEKGVPVTIVNATKPDYIYKTLKGKEVKSTLIEKE